MRTEGYVPVRKDSVTGEEWFDMLDFHFVLEFASVAAVTRDKKVPEWAADHPLQRVVRVVVMEQAEYERRERILFGFGAKELQDGGK